MCQAEATEIHFKKSLCLKGVHSLGGETDPNMQTDMLTALGKH